VRLVGAGTRYNARLPQQTPLAPDHVGLTEQSAPVLYWFSEGEAKVRVEFFLLDIKSGETVRELELGDIITAGFHSIDLAKHDVHLEIDHTYRWYVVLVPNPEDRSADIVSAAGIRRVAQGEGAGDWASLARRSLWYDAVSLAAAAEEQETGRTDPAWAGLLGAVGLEELGMGGADRRAAR
jgi:hypothetical protein